MKLKDHFGTLEGVYILYTLGYASMKTSLSKALLHLLRPIVRLCVKHGVKVDEVESVLKTLFIEEAKNYLSLVNEGVSVSKISIMTGLQRPAVGEIMRQNLSHNRSRATNLIMKVIGAWQTNPNFTTSAGKPRVLAFEGKQSEFSNLVSSVSQALNPYTVLYELERAKLVEKGPRGLKLLSKSFLSNQDVEKSLEFLSYDIADLTAAVEENIHERTNPLNHHLTTEYDNIPEDKIIEIKLSLLEEGEKFHSKIRSLLSSFDCDLNNSINSSGTIRVALCSFARCEPIRKASGEIQ